MKDKWWWCLFYLFNSQQKSTNDWYLTQFIFFMTFVNIYQIFKFLQRLWDILNLKLGIKFYFLNCFQIELLGIEELQTPLRINYVMGAIEQIHNFLVDSFLLECAAYVQETNRIRYRIFFLLEALSLISCAAVLYWIKHVDPWEYNFKYLWVFVYNFSLDSPNLPR